MSDPVTTTDVQTLVQEGRAALMAGDAYMARARYRQALDLDPHNADAWVGLAGAVRPYREKREHLQRALAINPQHPDALAILAQVEARLAAGEVLAPGGVQVREPSPAPGAAAPAMPIAPAPPPAPAVALVCYIHPDRETGLRCTSCDRPICHACVRPAPVGQLCPECAKIRRPVNYQVGVTELVVAGLTALIYGVILTFLAFYVLGSIGFFAFIVAFLLGSIAGDLLVRLVGWLTKNKRGREMQLTIGICYTVGALPFTTLVALLGGFPLVLVAFTVIVVSTAVMRIR